MTKFKKKLIKLLNKIKKFNMKLWGMMMIYDSFKLNKYFNILHYFNNIIY